MKQGKHYVDSKKLVDRTKLYDSSEALALCCQTAKAKFDETVEPVSYTHLTLPTT